MSLKLLSLSSVPSATEGRRRDSLRDAGSCSQGAAVSHNTSLRPSVSLPDMRA